MAPVARALLASALCAAVGASATAQSIGSLNRTGSGARAAGMANAFVAVSDDGTAASWNPAGLAQLRRPEFSIVHGSFDRDFAREGFRATDGSATWSSSRSDFTGTAPEFVSVAVPLTIVGRPVTFQVDWRRQYQFGGSLEADLLRYPTRGTAADQRFGVAEEGDGQVDLWSLAGAVRLGRHTSIGLSGSLWRGDWTFRSAFTATSLPPEAASEFLRMRQSQQLEGASLNLGLLIDHGWLRFGAVVKGEFTGDYSQQVDVASSRQPARREELNDLRARLPISVAVGTAVRPGGGWTVALDLTHEPWSRFAIEGAPGGQDLGFFDGLALEQTSTRDTVSVNVGAEKLFPLEGRVIPLRFGVAFEPQGPRDVVTLDPQDYVFLAVGSGYNTNRFKVDFAMQYGWNSYQGSALLATEPGISPRDHNAIGLVSSHEWRFKFSLIYRLTDTDKLMTGLKKIF